MIAVMDTCWRIFSRLPSVAKLGLAMLKNADEHDQGDEGRDVAQLIAQEIAQPKGACRSDLGALHIHLETYSYRQAAASS